MDSSKRNRHVTRTTNPFSGWSQTPAPHFYLLFLAPKLMFLCNLAERQKSKKSKNISTILVNEGNSWLNQWAMFKRCIYDIYVSPRCWTMPLTFNPKSTTPKNTQFSHLLTFYTNNAPDIKNIQKTFIRSFFVQQTTNKHFWHQGLTNPHTPFSPPTHSYPTSEVRFYFFILV